MGQFLRSTQLPWCQPSLVQRAMAGSSRVYGAKEEDVTEDTRYSTLPPPSLLPRPQLPCDPSILRKQDRGPHSQWLVRTCH